MTLDDPRVAVVGGGIAGLVAARDLVTSGARVTMFEPGLLGGKIWTDDFDGYQVEFGPDAFLTRVPEAVALCAELGLETDLVAPAAGRAALWWGDRLVTMPAGLVLGVPARLGPLSRSGLLSPVGLARAALDLVLPSTSGVGDRSVRELVAARFGAQVADRLVDPLVGGIHAGVTSELSASATTPQLIAAARRSRSLLRALSSSAPPAAGPVFLTPKGGLGVLVDRLVEDLESAGTTIERRAVTAVEAADEGVRVDDDPFDAVVLAVPAAPAAGLLGTHAPEGLRQITAASVTMVLLAYGADELTSPAALSGFLVPRVSGRLMTACSFASAKWPHWSGEGTSLLRVSVGRDGDHRHEQLDDDALVASVVDEIGQAMGTPATPRTTRVVRWPGAFPQYRVGHLDLVAGIEDDLRRHHPRVALAGASYRGSGIPACIRSAHTAAASVLAALPSHQTR
jgi:oxygen-dependent protoporphyrinogen oxidase